MKERKEGGERERREKGGRGKRGMHKIETPSLMFVHVSPMIMYLP